MPEDSSQEAQAPRGTADEGLPKGVLIACSVIVGAGDDLGLRPAGSCYCATTFGLVHTIRIPFGISPPSTDCATAPASSVGASTWTIAATCQLQVGSAYSCR